MKKFLFIVCLIVLAGYAWAKHEIIIKYVQKTLQDTMQKTLPSAKTTSGAVQTVKETVSGKIHTIEDFRKEHKEAAGTDKAAEKTPEVLVFHLKHGTVISGKVLEKTKDDYTVEWKGSPYVINVNQIARIDSKSTDEAMWQYKHYVVIKKTNGVIVDGKISGVDKYTVTFSFDEGGGSVEMGIDRKDIDHLMFAPVWDKESAATEARLKRVFPKMRVYSEGNVTIFTDSSETGIKSFFKDVNEIYTDDYLKFYKLFKDKKPLAQNFIVFFEDPKDFYMNMYADEGAVSLSIVGYFSPLDQTLYIFNPWGDKIDKIYSEEISGHTKEIEKSGDSVKNTYHDGSADIQIDGAVKAYTDAIWDWYYFHQNYYKNLGTLIMRHEFTHEIFHNWRLQSIIIAKPVVDKDKMAEKKKEILDSLESKDQEKREKLFVELMRLQRDEDEDLGIGVANSWLVEGIALYCDTTPIGAVDEERLFDFQEMQRKGNVNPIEFFTNFKIGSFAGLKGQAMMDAYAQSWAFTSFLMNKYEDRFIEYQRLMAEKMTDKKQDKNGEDDFNLLLKCLGKDLPALEKEFTEYMKTYEKADDPSLKNVLRYQKLKDEFRRLYKFGA